MYNIIAQLSKYLMIILVILYSFQCFTVFKKKHMDKYRTELFRKRVFRKQIWTMMLFLVIGFGNIYMFTKNEEVLMLLAGIILYIVIIQMLYRLLYPKASMLVVNNTCMLLAIGFVILARLDFEDAFKQFLVASVSAVIALIIPVIIRKLRFLNRLKWMYAILGILCLGVVLVLAQTSGGAKLSIEIGGISFQFSEIVKITYVFYMACALQSDVSFRNVAITTCVAALHVVILVLSTDLGTGVVFFMTYVVIVYVATKKPAYAGLALGGGSLAAVAAYFLFHHVRNRVIYWRDPFADYDHAYQIIQGMFAVGAGGWFGMGLYQGIPKTIPLATNDFVFTAICEELGGIIGICLILICMSMFLMILNISMRIKNPFYKLVALGLGTEYAFQVFLNIGGATKFIPMTGITLPLVSYGGSSVMSTMIMLAIIQGLYILREDEGEELERERQELKRQEQAIIDAAGIEEFYYEPVSHQKTGASRTKGKEKQRR